MYRLADERTATEPLADEILGSVAHNAASATGPAQTYEYVAMRILDGQQNGRRVVLGSPLYLALVH
jgi:hypothetical protein